MRGHAKVAIGQEGTLAIVGILTFERQFASGRRRSSCSSHPVRGVVFLALAGFGGPTKGVPALRPENGEHQFCCVPD
jgi:hypothetical protein